MELASKVVVLLGAVVVLVSCAADVREEDGASGVGGGSAAPSAGGGTAGETVEPEGFCRAAQEAQQLRLGCAPDNIYGICFRDVRDSSPVEACHEAVIDLWECMADRSVSCDSSKGCES